MQRGIKNEDFKFDDEKQPSSPPKTAQDPPENKIMSATKEDLRRTAAAGTVPPESKPEFDPKKQLEKFEPENLHYNYFYVSVTGQIESGQFPFLDGLSCKYDIIHGKDWNIADVKRYFKMCLGYPNWNFAARL